VRESGATAGLVELGEYDRPFSAAITECPNLKNAAVMRFGHRIINGTDRTLYSS